MSTIHFGGHTLDGFFAESRSNRSPRTPSKRPRTMSSQWLKRSMLARAQRTEELNMVLLPSGLLVEKETAIAPKKLGGRATTRESQAAKAGQLSVVPLGWERNSLEVRWVDERPSFEHRKGRASDFGTVERLCVDRLTRDSDAQQPFPREIHRLIDALEPLSSEQP